VTDKEKANVMHRASAKNGKRKLLLKADYKVWHWPSELRCLYGMFRDISKNLEKGCG
jgi:hypothetical protein